MNVRFVPDSGGDRVRVTWKLDATRTAAEQRVQSRLDASTLLQRIQAANLAGHLAGTGPVVLRATLPDPDTGIPTRVIRLIYKRSMLDAIDFSSPTFDPLTIFTLADVAEIDPSLMPTPTTTSSTTTSTTKAK